MASGVGKATYILGLETSCDETSVAIVRDGREVLSNVVTSQIDIHQAFGGVVPEVASRQHVLAIVPAIQRAFAQSGVSWDQIDCVAPTCGPGLVGSLLVGLNAGKGIAFARGLPLVGINHLEGHIYANWLTGAAIEFPLICLIVSGAHSDLVLMTDHLEYRILGRTRDDASGEAFDKVARLLGLEYPGGPAIQRLARQGDPSKLKLPRAWLGESYDFSFSGLKTAVLRVVEGLDQRPGLSLADVAASFEEAVVDVLVTKTQRAADEFGVRQVLLAGGVAANARLRAEMDRRVQRPVLYPPLSLCTDNAAMIAAAGFYRFVAGHRSGLDLDVHASLALI
ncbi:MAG TPA: tRNA (adenosine(37)-N6)-threonylcarbamoyltransferase complex transferase subunit TsaD [Chloroflexota bacterium]